MSDSNVSTTPSPNVGRDVAMEGVTRGVVAMIDSQPRIYVAGPLTGLLDLNYPAFDAETERLRGLGYCVENPAETPEQAAWADYMRHAIAKLVTCDEVALLPGWSRSDGAFMEYLIAKRLGIRCRRAADITDPVFVPVAA